MFLKQGLSSYAKFMTMVVLTFMAVSANAQGVLTLGELDELANNNKKQFLSTVKIFLHWLIELLIWKRDLFVIADKVVLVLVLVLV